MSHGFLCAGAALWDIIGRTAVPLPPGADVPGTVIRRPGGVALNIALALATLQRPVALLAALGRDPAGDELAARIAAAGIDAFLHRHDSPTDAYVAIEGPGGELHAAVADCAGLETAGAALLAPLADGRLPAPWSGPIVADGNLPAPVLDALLRHPAATGPLAIVHASPGKAARLTARPVTLYLNRREAEAVCVAAFPDSRAAAAALLARGASEAVVTDGAAPATAATAAGGVTLAPPLVATRSLTGAGDVFVAAHLAARADGLDPEAALRAALTASARHISREDP